MESQKGERELQRKRLRQIVEEFKKSDGSGKQEEQVREMSTIISSCSLCNERNIGEKILKAIT